MSFLNPQMQNKLSYPLLRHDGLLHETTEGRMRGKLTRERRRIQKVHDLANDGGLGSFPWD